jgi:hypothetical protein
VIVAVVATIASNLRLAEIPHNVRISSRDSRLAKSSVVNVNFSRFVASA